MMSILAVGAGGFIGAICRYLIGLIHVNEICIFPVKTFAINVIGCIAIETIAIAASKHASIHPHVLLFLKTGLCGGFTTFSTFALETADLIKTGHTSVAFIYAGLSVLAGVAVILAIEHLSIR